MAYVNKLQQGGAETVPDVIYHYTSADTLLKIIETNTVWASNLRYLNDVTEHDHCLRVLRARLPVFLASRKTDHATALEGALHTAQTGMWDSPYVASFSAESDFLPQWRSYCPNGNGVSIGFRTDRLRESTSISAPFKGVDLPAFHSSLNSVLYLDERNEAASDDLLEQCLAELDQWHEEQAALAPEERTFAEDDRVLESILSRWAALVKHPGFRTEREQRLVAPVHIFPSTKIFYRSSKTTIIPYAKVEMPKWGQVKGDKPKYGPAYSDYFLHDVVVGPTPNPDLTMMALQHCFMRMGVPVNVRPSRIPFRDL